MRYKSRCYTNESERRETDGGRVKEKYQTHTSHQIDYSELPSVPIHLAYDVDMKSFLW